MHLVDRYKSWLPALVTLIFCFVYQLNFSGYFELPSIGEDVGIVGTLSEGEEVDQTILRSTENIYDISLMIPDNFQNVSGILVISVYNNGELVGGKNLDTSEWNDSSLMTIPLHEVQGKIGDWLEIKIKAESLDFPLEMCAYTSHLPDDTKLSINNQFINASFLSSVNTSDVRLNKIWLLFVGGFILSLIFYKNIFQNMLNQKNLIFVLLCLIGVIVMSLRGGVFRYSQLYAEDGVYLSKMINDGFWKSCFSTRSGNAAGDFYNVGSYLLLGISWLINKMLHGYDISSLPDIIGVVSSVFYALVAVYSYYVLKRIHIFLGILSYGIVLLVPVGGDAPEIYGRILNTVYLYVFLALIIAMDLWDKRMEKSWSNVIREIGLLLCGLSFPVAFGILGIYIGYTFLEAFHKHHVQQWFCANGVGVVSIAVGMVLFPGMIGSKGCAEGLTTKMDSIIEFSFARHMFFPFIYLNYSKMTDALILGILIVSILLFMLTIWKSIKQEGIFNKFIFGGICGFISIASSIFMRRQMTALFDNYSSTFPDRYYYACNIIFVVFVFYALFT